ncbi:hypothetical protein GCM10008955_01590 [Deinococcus malanensis]|uniref:Uncharacterized protein n=1 Tax=Deinococcus malanensis TaxID=1706855 RepID=A0ABQ2EGY4_9DEIO|nr:hypothetical protein GCM10008955_01590 [Deinococcus malanensis]
MLRIFFLLAGLVSMTGCSDSTPAAPGVLSCFNETLSERPTAVTPPGGWEPHMAWNECLNKNVEDNK